MQKFIIRAKKNRSQAVMKTLDYYNKIQYISKEEKKKFIKNFDCCS